MKGSRASWLTLLVMVAVTIAAVVLFVVEPVKQESYTAVASGTAPHDEQVAAVDDQGRVVVVDPRAARVTKVLEGHVAVDDRDAVTIDRSTDGLAAHVGSADGQVSLVHLDTGGFQHVSDGRHPALSPDDQTLAVVRDGHLFLQNTTTGKQRDYGASTQFELDDVHELAWTPDGALLLLTSSSTQPVWRLPREAHQITDAVPVPLPTDIDPSAITALTGYDGGFALAVRDGGRTRIVRVAASVDNGEQPLTAVDGQVTKMDADTESASSLLFVVDGALERWSPSTNTIDHLVDGIVAASW